MHHPNNHLPIRPYTTAPSEAATDSSSLRPPSPPILSRPRPLIHAPIVHTHSPSKVHAPTVHTHSPSKLHASIVHTHVPAKAVRGAGKQEANTGEGSASVGQQQKGQAQEQQQTHLQQVKHFFPFFLLLVLHALCLIKRLSSCFVRCAWLKALVTSSLTPPGAEGASLHHTRARTHTHTFLATGTERAAGAVAAAVSHF